MRLRVIGRYSPFPAPGGACLGYLLEYGDESVLIECGSGVLSKLGLYLALNRITRVVLSHLHGDHCSDLGVLRYAADADLRFQRRPAPVRVYVPGEPAAEFARIAYKEAVEAVAVAPGDTINLGPFRFAFYPAEHPYPTVAMRIAAGGRVLAYSGDSGPAPGLVEAARGADLFLCEASLRNEDVAGHSLGHLTGRDAGRIAAEAGVRTLLLTHFFPGFDPEDRRLEAQEVFNGPVALAAEGAVYPV